MTWENLIQEVDLLKGNMFSSVDPENILRLVMEWNILVETVEKLNREQMRCGWILRSARRLTGNDKIPKMKWKDPK
jgi:hypothetical protein